MQFGETSSWVDLDTGQVETVSRELLRLVEEVEDGEDPDIPEWQEREWEAAKGIFAGVDTRYKELPTRREVPDWEIIGDFASTIESEAVAGELQRAVHGPGAFGRFKEIIRRQRIEPAWHAFREEALRQVAIDWCEEAGVPWE